MNKKILLFIIGQTFLLTSFAQYCGNSGSFQCTASNLSQPWLTPPPDSLPPFVNGQPSTTVIQFKNFNTVYFGGSYYVVNSLRIDTVDNLPAGLCWASNKADNTYANQESGCIKVTGFPCGPTGQYKMRIKVTVDLGFGSVQVDADQAGLKYYIRLKNNGDATTPIDTFQTAANPFIPYGGSCGSLPLVAYLGTDQVVCNGSVATLNPVTSGGQTPFTYSWSATGNSLSCLNCASPTVTLTQNSAFIVTVTDANNATVSDTVIYTVSGAGNNFQINHSGATTFCQGNSVLLGGTSASGFSYQWLQNNMNVDQATNTSITAASSGNYNLVFTGPGCYATSNTITVNVLDRPDASITAQPVTACEGDTIHLFAQTDTSIHFFHWVHNNVTSANTTSSNDITTGGVYKLIIKNSLDCYDTTSLNVDYKPLPQVTLNGNTDTVCSSVIIMALSGRSPSGGIYSGAGVNASTFSPAGAGVGTHVINYTYTDTASCSNTASENIDVKLCTGIEDLNEAGMISLYPNPVNNFLIIESPLIDNNTKFSVYDVTGKLQPVSFKTETGKFVLCTGNLSASVYSIQLKINGKEVTRRFIKAE